MTQDAQARYIQRLDDAKNPREMIEAQGEFTAVLVATVHTEVIQARDEVSQLRADVAQSRVEIVRLAALLESHLAGMAKRRAR